MLNPYNDLAELTYFLKNALYYSFQTAKCMYYIDLRAKFYKCITAFHFYAQHNFIS